MKNNMKKVALLVLALVVIGLGASSCGKDKACKCTFTWGNETETYLDFPENEGVESCSKLQDKLNLQLSGTAKYECKKF